MGSLLLELTLYRMFVNCYQPYLIKISYGTNEISGDFPKVMR